MPIVTETPDEFIAKHGGRPIAVDKLGRQWLLPDGAQFVSDGTTPPTFSEPAADPARAIRAYHAARLKLRRARLPLPAQLTPRLRWTIAGCR